MGWFDDNAPAPPIYEEGGFTGGATLPPPETPPINAEWLNYTGPMRYMSAAAPTTGGAIVNPRPPGLRIPGGTQPPAAPPTSGGNAPPPASGSATAPPGGYTQDWFVQNFGRPTTPEQLVALEAQDEMRVGQKNKLTYRWARTGSRPRAIHDQRTQSTYLFGAVCPERGTGATLVLPFCNTEAMQLHLDEIAARVNSGAHAILILDQAGWHGAKDLKIPGNLSLLPLPPRAPELYPQENIWQFMRQNWLSNRVFKSFDDIVDHCCFAWNTLIDQPWKIMSIARRDWAVVGQSI